MKNKLFTISLLMLFCSGAFSQIQPYRGITDEEFCTFDTICDFLIQDTSLTNIWQIAKPIKPFFNSAYSAPNAILTDSVNDYPVNNLSYFDIRFAPHDYFFLGMSYVISIKHKFETDTLKDGGFITVSYNNGKTWKNLIDDTCALCMSNWPFVNSENLYGKSDSLSGGNFGFSGRSNEWITTRFQWVRVLPMKNNFFEDTVTIRFNFISDSIQSNKEGWMIDDIVLSSVDLGGSINELDDYNNVNIYPNPFDDKTTMYLSKISRKSLSVKVYNIQGQLVRDINNIKEDEIVIERGGLKSGLYIIQIYSDNEIVARRKIVVNDF